MFIGEAGCFIVYIFLTYSDTKKYGSIQNSPALIEARARGLKTKMNPVLLMIPSLFDNLSSSLMFIALGFLYTSVYQMLRGIIVPITAFMSIMFLKKKLYRHHWTAIAMIVGGIALVGIAATIYSSGGGSSEDKHPVIGIILMVAA